MAKRGRKPKDRTIGDIDAGLRGSIDEAIRSHADESAASIYRRFGLSQRGLVLDTFRRYVGDVRRSAAGERVAARDESRGSGMTEREMIGELRRRVLVSALASLDAGDAKPYEVASMLARAQDFDRIAIEQQAAARAEEKHAAWKSEHERKQAAALEAMQGEAPGLTPELLAQIKSRVLGI